ncbi:MAG: VOC family protein, partial [Rhodomicrobium sp.]|nr:VOC family protein [Rhodomicrobium sp.]
MMMRFSENPEKPSANCMPADPNKIMHAEMKVGDALIMLSDGMAQGKPNFQGFSLTLTAKDEESPSLP